LDGALLEHEGGDGVDGARDARLVIAERGAGSGVEAAARRHTEAVLERDLPAEPRVHQLPSPLARLFSRLLTGGQLIAIVGVPGVLAQVGRRERGDGLRLFERSLEVREDGA